MLIQLAVKLRGFLFLSCGRFGLICLIRITQSMTDCMLGNNVQSRDGSVMKWGEKREHPGVCLRFNELEGEGFIL